MHAVPSSAGESRGAILISECLDGLACDKGCLRLSIAMVVEMLGDSVSGGISADLKTVLFESGEPGLGVLLPVEAELLDVLGRIISVLGPKISSSGSIMGDNLSTESGATFRCAGERSRVEMSTCLGSFKPTANEIAVFRSREIDSKDFCIHHGGGERGSGSGLM
jgi:hypothetical protein